MRIQFYKLARGARFEYKGKKWIKTAMSVASQEDSGEGLVIWGSNEVTPLKLLSEEQAHLWRPIDLEHWADHMTASPIARGDWGKTEPR